ncbi:MAG: hypothetical protein ACREQ5_35470, partial [Candidatus Dormibacteria bacterium]
RPARRQRAGDPAPFRHRAQRRRTGGRDVSDIAAESPSVIDLLDRLESMVVNGKRIVFTPNVVVNEDEALDLIDRARMQLPEEMKQAHWVIDEQDRLLSQARETAEALAEEAGEAAERTTTEAHAEAERLVATARQDAERLGREAIDHAAALVSQHAVTRAAEERARGLVEDAEERAAHVAAEADAYAREVMEGLDAQLQRTVQTVRKGIESLPAPESRKRRR